MCGRFTEPWTSDIVKALEKDFSDIGSIKTFDTNVIDGIIDVKDDSPIFAAALAFSPKMNQFAIGPMTWSTVPHHNARIETVQRPNGFWRNTKRCIIPMLSFSEHSVTGFFKSTHDKILWCAAITWRVNSSVPSSFVLVTTPSEGIVSAFHHRMPLLVTDPIGWIKSGEIGSRPLLAHR